MTCPCGGLPEIFKLGAHRDFYKYAVRVAESEWAYLYKCASCGRLWRADKWDKLQVQFVVRVPEGSDWERFDSSSLQKQFLVQSRGGLTQEPCIWQGCQGQRVKGVVYCVEHLYQTGARE
jgi:hypothetical protein